MGEGLGCVARDRTGEDWGRITPRCVVATSLLLFRGEGATGVRIWSSGSTLPTHPTYSRGERGVGRGIHVVELTGGKRDQKKEVRGHGR